ncbi:MAG: RrF2 family transcriptional regulator [Desulfobacterales bacterium]
MFITQKNQYALKAIVELAKHMGAGPIKISEIAKAQAIPMRFLEVILSQLKGSGFIDSKRGYTGGYYLIRQPDEITVGHVIRFLQTGQTPSGECHKCITENECPFDAECAFAAMWDRVNRAVFEIFDETTIKDLLDNERNGPGD